MAPAGPDRIPDVVPSGSLAARLRSDREFWNAAAREDAYFAVLSSPESRNPSTREAYFDATASEDLRRLGWFLHAGSRVLDLGCGVGRLTKALAHRCAEVTGVDISAEMVAIARARTASFSNVRIVETDGSSLACVGTGAVDFVVSLLCLIHVDRRAALRYFHEIRRVLAPGGRAWLQFQDEDQPEGAAALASANHGGFPMEGWTAPRLVAALSEAGLGVLGIEGARGFLDVQVCVGPSAVERHRLTASLRFEPPAELVDGMSLSLCERQTFAMRVHTDSFRSETAGALVALVPRGGGITASAWCYADVHLTLPSVGESEVRFSFGGRRPTTIDAVGAVVAEERSHSAPEWPEGDATLHVGVLPAGFGWNAESITLFPGCIRSVSVRIAP